MTSRERKHDMRITRFRLNRRRTERGDVPGWVMITVMSAGLVAVLSAVAGPQLRQMLTQALSAVGG